MTAGPALLVTTDDVLQARFSACSGTGPDDAGAGLRVVVAETLADALAALDDPAAEAVGAIILDLPSLLPTDPEVVPRARAAAPGAPIVALTEREDQATALDALHRGAQEALARDDATPERLAWAIQSAAIRHQRDAALMAARQEAQEASELKDRFVSLVAHDLRGPLGSAVALLDLTMMNETALTDSGRTSLRLIQEQASRILDLVGDLLDLSRLQTGKITPEPVFLDARFEAEAVIHHMGVMAETKGVRVGNRLPDGLRLYADRTLFGQVLQNLLSNAIKFSRPGAEVRFDVVAQQPTAIVVEDDGVGIPPAKIPKLFRVEEKTTTVGTAGEQGTGFGLPLSRNIMLAHGGDLTAELAPGDGSRFIAHLPEVRPRVLIVDDEAMPRTILRAQIQSLDADVVTCCNGVEALDTLRGDASLHLVITDIAMPDMDGFDLLAAIKSDPKTRDLPVIVVTGDERIETRDRALQMGALDYTVKPIEPNDLIPRVRRIIR